ncbi:MAG: glycosyltransferase family 4 protein [Chloroflexota bacterium]|nr:glycosyltransferase family 4 protein [Chloroflexota bacterium]
MRVLFLTNFYQIHGSGGEEQSCQQVVEGLKQRGHATLVLTSMHGYNNSPVEVDGVYRSLYLEMDLVPLWHSITFFTRRKAREKHNLQVFERVLSEFDPDIIFIWGMWNLPHSLAALAEAKYGHKVVYRFATYWPTLPSQHELYWRTPGRNWYSGLPKRVLGNIALAMLTKEARRAPSGFQHAICVSAATRNVLVEAGVPVSHARIIHTGLDVERYLNSREQHASHGENEGLNLLYAGRISPEKGISTLIEAMSKLVNEQGKQYIRLSLAGSGSVEHESHLRQLVSQSGLTDNVSFLGWVQPEDLPDLLRQFDVLVLPSIWPEPFARAVLEGMISGLVVVAARTGGTPEIIVDGKNGLLFAPNDPEDLAKKIAYLLNDPESRKQMRSAGRQTILDRFTMTKMMDQIESYLQEVASHSATQTAIPPETIQNPNQADKQEGLPTPHN